VFRLFDAVNSSSTMLERLAEAAMAQLKREDGGTNIRVREKFPSVQLAGVGADDSKGRETVARPSRFRRVVFAQHKVCFFAALLLLALAPADGHAAPDGDRRNDAVAPIDVARDAAVGLGAPGAGNDADRPNPPRFQKIDVAMLTSRVSRFGDSGVDGFLQPQRLRTNETGGATQRPVQVATIAFTGAARLGRPLIPARLPGARGTPAMRNKDVQPARNLNEIAPAPAPAPVDPYEPAGVEIDNLIFKPALEIATGYDSNPERGLMPRGSPVVAVSPELTIRSKFERHQINADFRGTFADNLAVRNANHPVVDSKVEGRYDVTDATHFVGEAHYAVDAMLMGGFLKQPLVNTLGGSAGVTQTFGPVEVTAKGLLDRIIFTHGRMADFQLLNTRDRYFTQPGVQLRVSYVFSPQISPFVDVTFDHRTHDLPIDVNGFHRDSDGVTDRAGAAISFGSLSGDASVGYLTRGFRDIQLQGVRGVVADATLAWQATEDTKFALVVRSKASESPDMGVSGVLTRDVNVQADQNFGPQLVGTVRAGYGRDQFVGTARIDNRYFVALGGVYKFSRMVQFKGDLRAEWTRSNVPVNDIRAIVGLIGVRLQY
jgi:hypothetical protein